MPDPGKLQALRDAGFKVVPTCATCVSFLPGSRPGWGRCSAISHDHAKHGPQKQTGVPINGCCPGYMRSNADLADHVGSYIEFYEEDDK